MSDVDDGLPDHPTNRMEHRMIPDGMPTLSAGAHAPGSGKACVMEYVALLAGEEWTDTPSCTNLVLARAAQRVNDRLPDSERYRLVPLIGRLFGTDAPVDNRRLALWCARSVEHLSPKAVALNDLTEGWLDGPVSRADLDAAVSAVTNAAAYATATAAYAADAASAAYAVAAYDYAYAAYAAADADYAYAAYAAYAATDADYANADADAVVDWLGRLIDEYDRLSGRTEHRDVTPADLAELAHAVTP